MGNICVPYHRNTFPSPDLHSDLLSSPCYQGTEQLEQAPQGAFVRVSLILPRLTQGGTVSEFLTERWTSWPHRMTEHSGLVMMTMSISLNRDSHFEADIPEITTNSFSASS